jgi:hypothetical protein
MGGVEVLLHSFFTSALEGGEWFNLKTRTPYLRKELAIPTKQVAGPGSEPVRGFWRRDTLGPLLRFVPRAVQPIFT